MNLTETPRRIRVLARIGAWGSIAAIAFVTLSPIQDRPVLADIRVEHVGAFAVIGMLFGIAYPKRLLPVLCTVIGSAALLEAAQHLAPGRHGRLIDFELKALGGACGVALASAIDAWLARRKLERAQMRSR